MSRLRAKCPFCRTFTAVALGPDYECHSCGREFHAGLVRVPQTGPLQLDTNFDPAVLAPISVLKIAEEEAVALTGSVDEVVSLGVPEVIVTLGTRGCIVYARGRVERVPARSLDGVKDPTGAGDGFAAAYVAARAEGHAPASAARRATALVAGLLSGRAR